MSFGFGVGDVITVGELAFKIHTRLIKVSKSAPKEVQAVQREASLLSVVLRTLEEDLCSSTSPISRAGPDRLGMVKSLIMQAGDTLKQLDAIVRKYEALVLNDGLSSLKRLWKKTDWALQAPVLDSLRAKVLFASRRQSVRPHLLMHN